MSDDKDAGGRGQAMVEFAIAFPLQLFITFGIMQLILLYVSALMVNYAAFRACRAAVVTNWDVNGDGEVDAADMIANARVAAQIVLAPLAGRSLEDADRGPVVTIPGWGNELKNSDLSYAKALVHEVDAENPYDITIVVEFDQELYFPLVDRLFALFLKSADAPSSQKVFGDEDEGFSGTTYSDRTPVYGDSERGRIRKVGGAYHYVIVRECTMYAGKGFNPRRDEWVTEATTSAAGGVEDSL